MENLVRRDPCPKTNVHCLRWTNNSLSVYINSTVNGILENIYKVKENIMQKLNISGYKFLFRQIKHFYIIQSCQLK